MLNMYPGRPDPGLSMDAAYSPNRDIAYVVPSLVEQLLPTALDKDKIPSWLKDHVNAHGLGEADFQRGVAALQASIAACNDPAVPNMQEAMRVGGFWALPDAVKIPPLMAFALLVIAYHAEGVKFATQGANPHRIVVLSEAMQDVVAAGKEAHRKDRWLGRFLRGKGV